VSSTLSRLHKRPAVLYMALPGLGTDWSPFPPNLVRLCLVSRSGCRLELTRGLQGKTLLGPLQSGCWEKVPALNSFRRQSRYSRRVVAGAAGLALAALTAAIVVSAGDLATTRARSAPGERIILVAEADTRQPILSRTISEFEAIGFTVHRDVNSALAVSESPTLVAFFVTRATYNDIPSSTWQSLYARHVIVGGLDISLHELQPLALPGSRVGSGRLRHNPERPIFSFLYSLGACGRGAMSDWLDNWPNLGGFVQQRALEIALAGTRGQPDIDCPADQLSGR
jgi:hypothetical protein